MISLEQWRAAIGGWNAGKLSAIYRRYGSRRIVRNWAKLLLVMDSYTAVIYYALYWLFAGLFAFMSSDGWIIALSLVFDDTCGYPHDIRRALVESPTATVFRVSRDYLQRFWVFASPTVAPVFRSCMIRLQRLWKLASPSVSSMLRLLLALNWLLIVAGDVELNPGPVPQEIKELLSKVDASELCEADIFDVFEEVVSLAGRWPSISFALRLLPSDKDTIARGCHDVPGDCLREVLSKWLQRGYDTKRYGPPTWQMLVAAVANSAGGDNPGLAKQIAENHQGTIVQAVPVPIQQALIQQPIVIQPQQYVQAIQPTQMVAAPLQQQAIAIPQQVIIVQQVAMQAQQPVMQVQPITQVPASTVGVTIPGPSQAVLPAAEGQPDHSAGTTQTARSNQPQAKLSINPSSTVVSRYAQYLRDSYQTQIPTFLTLQWPPPPTHKIFNLAMIQGKNIRYGPIDEEMVRLTLRGKVSDILYEKKPVELKDILQMDNAKHKVILIEGAPGSGKSTLAWHVCQTWESGKLFQNCRSVVYVQLRDPMIQSAQSVEDIIPAESRDQAEKVMEVFRSCRGQDLLIVMDGWDELPSDLHTKSIFHKLIAFPQSLNLHFCAVIVTSRPIASSNLYRFISSRIEILGFTPTELKEYFTEALGGESQAVQKLEDQLKECPMVKASCYLPLNAAIVSHLFLAQNCSLPITLHGVFTMLVLCCLQRYVAKQEQEKQIASLDNLPKDIQQVFKDIYTLAYHGVMDNRATFPVEYLESRGLPKISETLGLMQGVKSFTSLDSSSSFYFLHLSVQELLASFYISKLPGKEQVLVFNKLFGEPRFAVVFRFYAAFTKLETEGIRSIVADIIQKKEKHQMLYLFHGLYEANDLSLCQFVYSQLGGELDLRYTTLSPVDCLVVGYFISCVCLTGSGEFKAVLATCSIDDYRVSFLTKELSKCTSSARMCKPKLAATDAGVSSCLELKLYLWDNQVGDEGAILLCKGNVIHLLRTLNLSNNGISDNAGSAISEALKVNQSLIKLDLSYNGLSDNAVSTIAEALKVNQSLTILDLNSNRITDEGARAITAALRVNKSLRALVLWWNDISTEMERLLCDEFPGRVLL